MEVVQHFSERAKHDYELVLAARKGDQKAFAELLENYKDSVYYTLLKMVNNTSDAEDLMIEAFGKAFKNIEQYVPDFSFSTWLFKIALNNAIDFIRKKKTKHQHISIDTSSENNDYFVMNNYYALQSDALDPEEKYIKKQKKKQLLLLIKKLNPRYQKLVELRFFKEFSYNEIAEALEIPVGTVKARLFRAKILLYNILKQRKNKL